MAAGGRNPTGVEDALINPEVVVEVEVVEVAAEEAEGSLPLETGMMEMTSAWILDRSGHLNPAHPEVQELAVEVLEGEGELKCLPENTRSSRRESDSDQNMCNCLYRRST